MPIAYSAHLVNVSDSSQQEGKHPLTGQHAVNFRLLANQ